MLKNLATGRIRRIPVSDRTSSIAGRTDDRIVALMEAEVNGQTQPSTDTKSRAITRTQALADTEALDRKSRITLARNAASTATARRGLALSWAAGMGKSTALLLIGKRHEKAERRRLNRKTDAAFAPVVYAVVPPATTPKMLMQAFAQWLGLPMLQRATAPAVTEQLVSVLRTLSTSLVIVDEVHHLRTNRQAGAEAASTLKQFSDRLDATFLYAGMVLRYTPVS